MSILILMEPGKALAENRRARFDYEILETLEAGIELLGHEVKSVSLGRATLAGSFAIVRGGECFMANAQIPPYQVGNVPDSYDPVRTRRLLLKHEEIMTLMGQLDGGRITLVPLKMYRKRGVIKVLLGLARSRKKADKRSVLKERAHRREMREGK